LDATQTSDPPGIGPGTPGQASAFRRALDEQALPTEAREGPLDLTIPLDYAEIRAALSSSGSNRKPPVPEDLPPPPVGGGRRGRRRGGEHAAIPGHAGSKRLGRIGVFVTLATALSVGTAAALVLSSGGQGASVSLPTTNGNLPVATAVAGGPGQGSQSSATASAGPSASPSPSSTTASASPSPSRAPVSAGASAASQPSTPASADPTTSQDSGSPSPTASAFTTLQEGSSGTTVTTVQQLLDQLGYLTQQHQHRSGTVFVDVRDRMFSDPSGSYGYATASAVASFQQDYGVGAQPGVCDQSTFDALSAQASGQ
jgi:hypothetical protein